MSCPCFKISFGMRDMNNFTCKRKETFVFNHVTSYCTTGQYVVFFYFCAFTAVYTVTKTKSIIFYLRFYPLHLFSYLNSWERVSIFPFECSVLHKGTTGTIFITSLVWCGSWLGIEPGTYHTWSQHSTTRLSSVVLCSCSLIKVFIIQVLSFKIYCTTCNIQMRRHVNLDLPSFQQNVTNNLFLNK